MADEDGVIHGENCDCPGIMFEAHDCGNITIGITNALIREDSTGKSIACIYLDPHEVVGFCANLLMCAHEQVEIMAGEDEDDAK